MPSAQTVLVKLSKLELSRKQLIAVVGGSHANRLADALAAAEAQVCAVATPGWKVTRKNVEDVVLTLTSLSPAPDTVVIQCLDNSSYFVCNEDGSLTIPGRSRLDIKFHVKGELKVANREQVNNLMKLINPLLTCLPGAKVLLVSCLPRFLHSGCCASEGHMVDFDKAKLVADLVSMTKNYQINPFWSKTKECPGCRPGYNLRY